MPELTTIVSGLMQDLRLPFYQPSENLLFRFLYDSYCQLEGIPDSFDALVRRGKAGANPRIPNSYARAVYQDAVSSMFAWYSARYPAGSKSKGIKRYVHYSQVFEDTPYHFDDPFGSAIVENYLLGGGDLTDWAGLGFLMHTSVAFLLRPAALDLLLQHYGFHPLNVRNIHHMAVYVVLNNANQLLPRQRKKYNPFPDIQELYMEAREKIRAPLAESGPAEPLLPHEYTAFAGGSRLVGQLILPALDQKNLLTFVERHASFYTLQHRRLLAEHRRMADLFAELYMEALTGRAGDEDDDILKLESEYSFCSFFAAFCNKFNPLKFRQVFYDKIRDGSRQPSREIMILLWLFSYTFLFFPVVYTVRNYDRAQSLRYQTGGPEAENYPLKPYYSRARRELRVKEYLSDHSAPEAPLRDFEDSPVLRFFDGAELMAFLNSKLTSFSMRQMDDRDSFDRAIRRLEELQITLDEDGSIRSAKYGTQTITDAHSYNVGNIPGPLVLITAFLREVDAQLPNVRNADGWSEKQPLSTREKRGLMPARPRLVLPCDFFDLL